MIADTLTANVTADSHCFIHFHVGKKAIVLFRASEDDLNDVNIEDGVDNIGVKNEKQLEVDTEEAMQ
ncbi:hypothetical protein GJ496_008570 [Pomphorhynchus laevis]|nr:hypothetical protein GJ496_008570 [Pomphorhynchus laevis]